MHVDVVDSLPCSYSILSIRSEATMYSLFRFCSSAVLLRHTLVSLFRFYYGAHHHGHVYRTCIDRFTASVSCIFSNVTATVWAESQRSETSSSVRSTNRWEQKQFGFSEAIIYGLGHMSWKHVNRACMIFTSTTRRGQINTWPGRIGLRLTNAKLVGVR